MKHILLPIVLSGLFVVSCGRKDNTIAENKDIKTIKIPQNPRYEKKYKEVVAGIKEGDNPIVFVYKLKR